MEVALQPHMVDPIRERRERLSAGNHSMAIVAEVVTTPSKIDET